MIGWIFTLPVSAESEAEKLAKAIARYGAVTCALRQENDEILLTDACIGGAYLNAAMVADTDDFSYSTNSAEYNLDYSISGELHQTLMSRFYFYNAFDAALK